MEILYGIWPPKCPCSRTVISLEYPDPEGEHFCQKWRKIRRFIDPDQGANCRRKTGGHFSSTMSTRSYSPEVWPTFGRKKCSKIGVSIREKNDFFFAKDPIEGANFGAKKGVPRTSHYRRKPSISEFARWSPVEPGRARWSDVNGIRSEPRSTRLS